MKGQIICLLALNLIFIWGGVYGFDPFDDVANHSLEKQSHEAEKFTEHDAYNIKKEDYIEKFKHFLQNFNSGESVISEKFDSLDEYAWEGHYITKAYLDPYLRSQISLQGTPFQDVHSDIIDSKNKWLIRKIKNFFVTWSRNMLVETQVSPQINMEKIRILFTVALLALEDTKAPNFKEFEVFFVYFIQILKRMRLTRKVYHDSFISESCERFENKYFRGVGCSDDDVATTCCVCQKSAISGYVKSKIDLIKEMNHKYMSNSHFSDVSKEFENLYFTIFASAPVYFDVRRIEKHFAFYQSFYSGKKDQEADFRIVLTANTMLLNLFDETPNSRYKNTDVYL